MKQMSRDPNAADRARRAEEKADAAMGVGGIRIKPISLAGSSAGGGNNGGKG